MTAPNVVMSWVEAGNERRRLEVAPGIALDGDRLVLARYGGGLPVLRPAR